MPLNWQPASARTECNRSLSGRIVLRSNVLSTRSARIRRETLRLRTSPCVLRGDHVAPAVHEFARPETPVDADGAPQGPASGPPIKQLYHEAAEKALRDPKSLSRAELSILVNGLPRHYRHKHVPPQLVEEAFDGGMLTLHELARTLKLDLNVAVKYIGEKGELRKALRLTDYLVRTTKANQHTIAAFFQACATVNRPTVAARVWEMWVQSGLIGQVSASAAIDCVVSYDADMGLAMLERMQQLDIPVHRNNYHQVLKALADVRNFQGAVSLFETMKQNRALEPSTVTIQHMLNVVHACQAWEYTEDVYRYMVKASIIPDSQAAASFMKVYCCGMDYHLAEIIFRSKLKQWNISPDRYHFNALLMAHARQGDIASVNSLLREMEHEGVAPDECSIVSALTAAARSATTALADIEWTLRLAQDHNLQHNTFVCGALIQAYRNCMDLPPKRRQERAESTMQGMEEAGTPMNSVVVNSLLALYWETYDYRKARQQYDKMIESGIMPNARTCQIMMHMCEEAGWPDEAKAFRELRETMPTLEGASVRSWNSAGTERVNLES